MLTSQFVLGGFVRKSHTPSQLGGNWHYWNDTVDSVSPQQNFVVNIVSADLATKTMLVEFDNEDNNSEFSSAHWIMQVMGTNLA